MSRKNYTDKEKEELLRLAEKYKTIVQDKGTKSMLVEKKKKAWKRISIEFNKTAETPRTAKQLWRAFFNHRQRTGKKMLQEKKPIVTNNGESYNYVGAQMLQMEKQEELLPHNCVSTDYCKPDEEDISSDSDSCLSSITDEKQKDLDNHGIEVLMLPSAQRKEIKTEPFPSYRENAHHYHQTSQKKQRNHVETSALRTQFFKVKLESAIIEKRTNFINYKIALNKAKLIEMELKLKQLEYNSKNTEL